MESNQERIEFMHALVLLQSREEGKKRRETRHFRFEMGYPEIRIGKRVRVISVNIGMGMRISLMDIL